MSANESRVGLRPEASESDLQSLAFAVETLWRLIQGRPVNEPLDYSRANLVAPETEQSGTTTRVFIDRNTGAWAIAREDWRPENQDTPDGPIIRTTTTDQISVPSYGSSVVERGTLGPDYTFVPGEVVSLNAGPQALSALVCADHRDHIAGLIEQVQTFQMHGDEAA